MRFTVEKLDKLIADLRDTIHRETIDITRFKYIEGNFEEVQLLGDVSSPAFDDSAWADFQLGDYWGGYDKGAWFRAKLAIPDGWADKKLSLRFLVGPRDGGGSTAEALLYVDGKPLQGIDVWHEEAWLPGELAQKGEVALALKAWSGVLRVPKQRKFTAAQLHVIDEPAERLYDLAVNLLKAVRELEEVDLRRVKLLHMLEQSFLRIDFIRYRSDVYYETVQAACDQLTEAFEAYRHTGEIAPTVIGVGHSHIDMAWLWRLAHSREKASRTFSTVLHLMKQYPEYRFMHTSPQLYAYLKQDYPDIYREVKERIASGEWEITGGMWVEPDTNIPNGESLIRQILFGKRFMMKEFGVETKVAFLPDVFGYNAALPQIIRRSGIPGFITSKISWNQYNRFPNDTFMWRGIDGTELLTHFITTPESGSKAYTYNGIIDPFQVKGTWDQYKQKDVNDELLMAYGWGDGGGGPTKEMLEAADVLKQLPGFPRLELGKMEPYMERLSEQADKSKLPVWHGELYLEYHRGTYTSQAFIKRANRLAEILYHQAEWLSAMTDLMSGGSDYPREQLNEGWERILLNQFHDILPGSSIRQVYEDARDDYAIIDRIGREAQSRAMQTLAGRIRTESASLIVWNSLSWQRDGLALTACTPELERLARDGDDSLQIIRREDSGDKAILMAVKGIPSLGYKAIPTVELGGEGWDRTGRRMTVQTRLLENDFYRIKLNDAGQFESLYDKRHDREVLAAGERGNVLQLFEDRPINFDAWDIDIYYQQKMTEMSELMEAEVEEEGPLRGVLRLVWRFNASTVTQLITIYRDCPRIDFRTTADWQEKQTLLKAAFPVGIQSARATYDIQFGNIERPTHWNTSWDYARFEVCAHKWADLSEGNYGVALLNDCKYGYDIKDHVMRLTLIKSSIEPDETADRGTHTFCYSLLPHIGTWREGQVAKEAYELGYPLLTTEVEVAQAGELPAIAEFAALNGCDHAMIETVKKAEDEDAYIVRVYEYKQFRANAAVLRCARPIRKAVECNLVEEEEREAEFSANEVTFSLRPYEIKTFKLWF